MFQRIKNSYYTKLTVVCIAAVCTITMLLLPLCTRLIWRQEQTEKLKNYDLALNALSNALYSREDTLASSLAPLFSDETAYRSLLSFYRSTSKKVPTQYSSDVLKLLSAVCSTDSYCCGALLMTRTGHLYQYRMRYESLVSLDLKKTTKSLTPYQLQVLTDSQIENLSNDFQKPVSHIYGLCTSIFDPYSDSTEYLGTMILLFSTSEFSSIMDTSGVDPESAFYLLDEEQNILFSSSGSYDSETSELAIDTDHLKNATLASENETDKKDLSVPVSALYNSRYRFYTAYQLPDTGFSFSYIQIVLIILTVGICLAAVILYLISFQISDRKINTIQRGMKLVGKNNLDYRLPVPAGNDEFTQIILSFNSMCDALQRNVEKAYLYEIAQRKAELYAMQTSINPHFLYNALEQIRVKIMQGGSGDASHMLLLLSKMYRNQTRRNLYISIAEECSQSENLINFYMYRYGDFDYEFRIHSSVKIYGLPKNTLQPLIENYFVHGYIPDSDDNFFSVTVSPEEIDGHTWIRFHVENNGNPISPEDLASLKEKLAQPVMANTENNNGFALSNINQRLKLVFGNRSGLIPSVGSDGTGFLVTFVIPARLPEELSKS